VTAVSAKPREGIDFFPLTVDFVEKTSAAGKIPGGFFKREGRLSDREVLVSRFIDRSIRPLFADGYRDETQITATVLSADGQNHPGSAAFLGASVALHISDIPFLGPIGAVRVARVGGQLIANPLKAQLEQSDLELVVAGSQAALVMVEGGMKQCASPSCSSALRFAHRERAAAAPAAGRAAPAGRQAEARSAAPPDTSALEARIRGMAEAQLREATRIKEKQARYTAIAAAESAVVDAIGGEFKRAPATFDSLEAVETRRGELARLLAQTKGILHDLRSALMRERILTDGVRIDGRSTTDNPADRVRAARRAARPWHCRVHARRDASAGLGDARQRRRQADDRLAHRALREGLPAPLQLPALLGRRGASRCAAPAAARSATARSPSARSPRAPEGEDFPYTVRLVAETLESNGSSSMATVCGSTLALMDAGVPIQAPVAGIAMGLIEEGDASRSSPTSSATRTTWATWTSRSRVRATA
jgi:polyribonucleotide nucleotidyltransferase